MIRGWKEENSFQYFHAKESFEQDCLPGVSPKYSWYTKLHDLNTFSIMGLLHQGT